MHTHFHREILFKFWHNPCKLKIGEKLLLGEGRVSQRGKEVTALVTYPRNSLDRYSYGIEITVTQFFKVPMLNLPKLGLRVIFIIPSLSCTLTATSVPSRVTARCTCASEAAANGTSLNSLKLAIKNRLVRLSLARITTYNCERCPPSSLSNCCITS